MSETQSHDEGNKRPKIEWDSEVPELHRRLVDSGLFDQIPPLEEYITGDAVVSRYSDEIYHVYGNKDDNLIVGYDKDDEHVRKTLPKDDLRGIQGYAKIMFETGQPMTEIIDIDRHGHAKLKHHIRKTTRPEPHFPGRPDPSNN